MSDGTLLCSAIVVIMALVSVTYLIFPFDHRASTRKLFNTANAPPHSVSPTTKNETFEETFAEEETTSAYKSTIPTDMPTPPPSPRGVSSRKKPSITALITDILPSRRGSIPSPATSAVETGELPIVNRSDKEIETYGDFPDYATLSGVRLPDPYLEFNIEKALPRPYRPLRWSYHQTMGMLSTTTLLSTPPVTCLS